MAPNRPRALQVFAGPRALSHLRERGLKPADVRVMPAAAGGPKGLVLNPLDRFLFGHWLAGSGHTVHLLGASIGAWRMACATLPDADAALAQLAELYIHQQYDVPEGGWPDAAEVSRVFAELLGRQFGGREAEVLGHPRYRLHVLTSRGRAALLRREGRWRTPLGYAGAYAANLRERAALGRWLERVVFSDPRDALPLPLTDFATRSVALVPANLGPALQASGSIPFVLKAVHDISGAPPGAYWDGGITDYHLHLDYAAMADGLVLYPHFQRTLVPGWLDKGLKRR
ncbi:MAG: phospholipase, partial [Burkholderiaceae bacterium]|nr:phospholipase [Burkholderiaceae bacterium]